MELSIYKKEKKNSGYYVLGQTRLLKKVWKAISLGKLYGWSNEILFLKNVRVTKLESCPFNRPPVIKFSKEVSPKIRLLKAKDAGGIKEWNCKWLPCMICEYKKKIMIIIRGKKEDGLQPTSLKEYSKYDY